MSELLDRAAAIVKRAQELGAHEVTAYASQSTNISLTRREGKVEQATEATSRGVSVSLFVDGKYSSHSTSDLRPEAVDAFLKQAVAATRYLEPDPDRALPAAELCGRGVSEEALDQDDPTWYGYSADARAERAEALEAAVEALRKDDVISHTAYLGDGSSESARVMSNGFADSTRGAWFSQAAEMTLDEGGGKRPEAMVWYAARHLADMPSLEDTATELDARARERLGAGPIESGTYPLILLNRATGRILGALGGPLSGGNIHYGQSCLADALGQRIGSDKLTIIDDPTVPRGLGSRAWDGDGFRSQRRTIIDKGVVEQFYLSQYYARKLDMQPTTGSRSNWIVPPGEQSWQELAKAFPKAILVNSFLGGNSNPTTGDFSFGIRGMLVENGEIGQSLSEMNVSGNIKELFHKLVAVGDDPWTWAALRTPTLIFDGVDFSGV